MEKTFSTKELRERKFLGWVPVVALPVVTLFFWAFGGGRAASALAHDVAKGWNMRMPVAYLARLKKLSKLEYYEQAAKDSVSRGQRLKMADTYAKRMGIGGEDTAVARVREKLAAVERLVRGEPRGRRAGIDPAPAGLATAGRGLPREGGSLAQANVEKLERIVGALRQRESAGDPEMAQLSAVLDKLAAVQRVAVDTARPNIGAAGIGGGGVARLSAEEGSRRVSFPVKAVRDPEDSLVPADTTMIEALVPEDQMLVSGGELRLELATAILVGGRVVGCGTPVFGVVGLSGERLRVTVGAINSEGRVFPVNLVVADQDGLPGIYIPGAPAGDAVRESAEQDVGLFEPSLLSTTVAGQAATAGVGLARSLVSKKLRPVKLTVPAGYRVILHEQNKGL